jgi:sec-independent protein translocase protein TatC
MLLALPMWMLFEAGLFFGRLIKRRGEDQAAAAESDDNQNS